MASTSQQKYPPPGQEALPEQGTSTLPLLPPPEQEAPILLSPEELRILRIEFANLGFAFDTLQEELVRVRLERDRMRNKLRLIYTVMMGMFSEREPPNVREAWHTLRAYAQMIRRYLGVR